jgi:uncharacterized Rmd1/YagE family protein
MRCAAFCIATAFDNNGLLNYLKSQYTVTRFREVLHVQLKVESKNDSDVFFFPYGAVVCWGLDEHFERDLLQTIRRFALQPVEPIEDDVFTYEFGEEGAQVKIEEDEIILPDHNVLTKLAFSHGMAQSVKLAAFEQTIQRTIHLTRELPELLAQQGGIRLSRKDIRKMMGRLFIDRSSINLHQELLDTPEFFWEHTDLEPFYALMAHYLDRERRVNVLNQRLLILQELFDMLAAELNHQHSSRLEWTIIILIVIEVVLIVGKDLLKIW